MKKLLNKTISDEQFDYLMCQQSEGKQLIIKNEEVVAEEFVPSPKQTLLNRLSQLKMWFSWYDNQVCQYQRSVRQGVDFDKDILELDNKASEYQSEISSINQQLKQL